MSRGEGGLTLIPPTIRGQEGTGGLWTVLSVVVRVATVTLPGTLLNSLPPLNHLTLEPTLVALGTPGNYISHII